jgi:hypothetical protein
MLLLQKRKYYRLTQKTKLGDITITSGMKKRHCIISISLIYGLDFDFYVSYWTSDEKIVAL